MPAHARLVHPPSPFVRFNGRSGGATRNPRFERLWIRIDLDQIPGSREVLRDRDCQRQDLGSNEYADPLQVLSVQGEESRPFVADAHRCPHRLPRIDEQLQRTMAEELQAISSKVFVPNCPESCPVIVTNRLLRQGAGT